VKISVDYDRCEGHGLCAGQAPAVFSLDDEANLTYRFEGSEVPGEHAAAARAAVSSCPVAALRALS
jgi:ferredoxin